MWRKDHEISVSSRSTIKEDTNQNNPGVTRLLILPNNTTSLSTKTCVHSADNSVSDHANLNCVRPNVVDRDIANSISSMCKNKGGDTVTVNN